MVMNFCVFLILDEFFLVNTVFIKMSTVIMRILMVTVMIADLFIVITGG